MSTQTENRKLSRRDFCRGAAVAASAVVLGACAPQAATPTVAPTTAASAGGQPTKAPEKVATPAPKAVNVTWWVTQGAQIGELLHKFATEFSTGSGGITVKDEFQGGYVEAMNKVIAAAAANALPDMLLIGDGQYPPLARSGILLPLDDLIKGPDGMDLSQYRAPINRGRLDGRMYQLCYGVSTPIFYYNKDAVEAAGLKGAPETWNDFFGTYAPKLTTKNMAGFVYHIDNWWQQSAVWSCGAMVKDDNWEIDLANPAVVDWFERMQKARQKGEVYVPSQADGGAIPVFGAGRGAMCIQSTGTIGNLDKVTEGKFKAECAFLPSGPGGRWVPSGGNGLSIIRGVKDEVRDASWKFIKYLYQPEQTERYVRLTGYIPFDPAVEKRISDLLQADPRRKVAIDQLQYSRWHMKIHTLARAAQEMWDAWTECVQTDVNVKDRLRRLQEACVKIAKEEGINPVVPS